MTDVARSLVPLEEKERKTSLPVLLKNARVQCFLMMMPTIVHLPSQKSSVSCPVGDDQHETPTKTKNNTVVQCAEA